MGFDLYGVKATSKSGEYFRNNVWYWRPLWAFVGTICNKVLTPEEIEQGTYNNGYEITQTKALAIALLIEKALKDGRAKQLVKDYRKDQAKAKIENKGKDPGEKGFKNWTTEYPLTLTNIREFARFTKHSGGFTIC